MAWSADEIIFTDPVAAPAVGTVLERQPDGTWAAPKPGGTGVQATVLGTDATPSLQAYGFVAGEKPSVSLGNKPQTVIHLGGGGVDKGIPLDEIAEYALAVAVQEKAKHIAAQAPKPKAPDYGESYPMPKLGKKQQASPAPKPLPGDDQLKAIALAGLSAVMKPSEAPVQGTAKHDHPQEAFLSQFEKRPRRLLRRRTNEST